ncbi:site-specific integrase [uncultured Agrobacterium sp.]|uniref:site-specific integrase n=1 Tax=uncultured Agrobacterium sp. TaxID=157277 RepID=UPI0025DA5D35|nr:site-specific integrase [uncultured Agrobacterium sp.]
MPRPMLREGSSVPQFRRRVPADILDIARGKFVLVELPAMKGEPSVPVTVTAGQFIKFSLQTYDPDIAKFRHAAANIQVDRHIQAWRQGPSTISHIQIVALSGEIYRLLVDRFRENPGSPANWAAFKAFNRAAQEGRLLNAPSLMPGELPSEAQAFAIFGAELTQGVNAMPADTVDALKALEARFGVVTDWILQKHGLSIDAECRAKLLRHVATSSQDAGWSLKRNAEGDYTPDTKAARFPPVSVVTASVKITSVDDLFDKWANETKPAASTHSTWKSNLRNLKNHLGPKADDITRITAEDIVSWKDAAVARELASKTINSSYLGMAKTLFNYAISNKMLSENPAENVRAAAKSRAGSAMLPYTDEEVARLLALAANEESPQMRWLPWLAACSGARIGEVAQLWGNRIKLEDGIHVMLITPAEDGGSIKNEGSERVVPIHPALIKAGFLDFVKSKGNGPLFYRRNSGRASSRHSTKGVTNRLSTWIREQGFTDPRKAPNHALRHYFKSAAAKVGISDSLADAIQGHAAKNDAGRYRHFDIKTKAEAIASLPFPPKMPKTDKDGDA